MANQGIIHLSGSRGGRPYCNSRRAMYEHQGGMWKANESQDVWFGIADRLIKLLQETRT